MVDAVCRRQLSEDEEKETTRSSSLVCKTVGASSGRSNWLRVNGSYCNHNGNTGGSLTGAVTS